MTTIGPSQSIINQHACPHIHASGFACFSFFDGNEITLHHGDALFYEVYLVCDYTTCARRDPKGLYARAETGEAIHFPGKDMVFEEPSEPDLVLETASKSVEDCVESLVAVINRELIHQNVHLHSNPAEDCLSLHEFILER